VAISVIRLDLRSPAFSPARTEDLYAAALDIAAWADTRGFDSITVSEHHGVEDGFLPAPIPMMGALAGRTRKLRIGAAALLVPLYEPVKLAEDLAVLDLASRGRVGITAGIGYRPSEFAMLGRDWERRGQLMDEALDLITRAWPGEPIEWQGRRVQLTPRPLTQPKPPIFVGASGKPGARRAARFGLPFQPAKNSPELFELYLSECRRLGVESPLVLPPGSGEMTWVSEDPDRTWSQIGRYLLHDAVSYASWQIPGQESAVYSQARSVDELRAEGKYRVLTPEECVKQAEPLGPFASFVLFPLCGGTPPELAWPSLELYAVKVLPRLRAQ
jgi:alkanesulfonate monooxygenase SsuD/methylene tetrahydromethanopterin reductase-like flavin-dependent oxidoreductase (luciferase family)